MISVSIHAPARGATDLTSAIDKAATWIVSIHAPARGATRFKVDIVQPHILMVSIHAPARGATHASGINPVRKMFQSTRPRGARHWQRDMSDVAMRCFNPRAREGRDHERCS